VDITPDDIRFEFPEFSGLSDLQIQSVLDRASRQIQIERWGDLFQDGIKTFTAHTLMVRYINKLDIGGYIKSLDSDKSSGPDFNKGSVAFESTIYGLEYLQLLSQLGGVGFVV